MLHGANHHRRAAAGTLHQLVLEHLFRHRARMLPDGVLYAFGRVEELRDAAFHNSPQVLHPIVVQLDVLLLEERQLLLLHPPGSTIRPQEGLGVQIATSSFHNGRQLLVQIGKHRGVKRNTQPALGSKLSDFAHGFLHIIQVGTGSRRGFVQQRTMIIY
uniref:(northern house mosquito) hypothetical protein n=1 Tax=Culex pipiens TaxID=7175 RepID=A0A8D8PB05_CULPI